MFSYHNQASLENSTPTHYMHNVRSTLFHGFVESFLSFYNDSTMTLHGHMKSQSI